MEDGKFEIFKSAELIRGKKLNTVKFAHQSFACLNYSLFWFAKGSSYPFTSSYYVKNKW